MEEYLAMWKNYANFSDRTSVRGYWMAVLFNMIIIMILTNITIYVSPYFYFVSSIYSIAALIPGIALCVRRLRDAGKHWASVFINFIPFAGQIVFIIWLCQPTCCTEGKQVS